MTSLGLVQMTRKRMGTGLLEVFGEQCETCAGRGIVTHDEPVEHRRANVVAAEHHVPRRRHQPAARTDRKSAAAARAARFRPTRVRGSGAVHPEPTDAERHAKAEATRAALANIAAAAHAAHLHEDAAHALPTPPPAGRAAAGSRRQRPRDGKSGRPGAVLTFGGEKVVLPFVEHADETQPKPRR